MAAYNFARRLKTLGGLTPYEYICKIWTSEPDRFILNPIHQMPGLNTYGCFATRPILSFGTNFPGGFGAHQSRKRE